MEKYDYGIILFDSDENEKKVLDYINKRLDETYNHPKYPKFNVFLDVCDLDNGTILGVVDFNQYTGEDEVKVMDLITSFGKEIGVKVVFDDYPDIDEDSFSSYSYSVELFL